MAATITRRFLLDVSEYKLVDVHNACMQYDLEFDVKEQCIILLEVEKVIP